MLSFSTPRSGQSQNLIKREPEFYLLKYWKTNSTLLMICQRGHFKYDPRYDYDHTLKG